MLLDCVGRTVGVYYGHIPLFWFLLAINVHQDPISRLTEQMAQLSQAVLRVMSPPAQFPPLSMPERYAGEQERCKGFLLQCSLFFSSHPDMPEARKIAHFLRLLTGHALLWATAVWEQEGGIIAS